MTSVAVVGTGSAGRRHATNLLAAGASEVILVSRSRREPLSIDGASFDVVDRLDDALRRVDAVVIANPTSLHVPVLEHCLDSGKHVLCEKPVAVSAAGIGALIETARARDLVVGVGCQMRFHPLLVELRDRVRAGHIGVVIDAETTQGEHLADYHPDEDYRGSYAARAELGGGVLLTQIHQLDFLHWILGGFARVMAVGGTRSQLEIDVEDTVSYLLVSCDGVPVRAHVDYLRRPKRLDLTVTGTDGALHWDYYAARLDHTDASGATNTTLIDKFERNEMFVALIEDFLTAISTGAPPRATLVDAAHELAVIDAVRMSIREERSVAVSHARLERP